MRRMWINVGAGNRKCEGRVRRDGMDVKSKWDSQKRAFWSVGTL